MNSTAKKALRITTRILTWLLIAFAVFMMIFTIFTVSTVNKNDRSFFGLRFYIVKTDSMSLAEDGKNKDLDVHFDAGDIIIVEEIEQTTVLKPGDIITFVSMNEKDGSRGETITHMIRRVEYSDSGKILGYVTYGTNTGVDDEALVEPEYVLGTYWGQLPNMGHFFAFMQTTKGYIICILVPFMLLILYNGMNVIRLFRRYKREQMADMANERTQLEAERAENRRMLEELMALKSQLSGQDGLPPQEAPPAEQEALPPSQDGDNNTQ